MLNPSREVLATRVVNATAAGTTAVNGTVLDMANWEGVMFVASFGALTATQVTKLKIQQGLLADGSDMADLEGSATAALADGDGNKMLIAEVYQPRERYVRCVVVRGTANAVVDSVVAYQYGPRKIPVTQSSTVSAAKFVQSPAEGTA